ncbi:MAG: hypothetical protein ACOY81_06225 [Bacillota bacterium]|uniref:hypothetical protein n=1 Tax=Desulfurispora thermophila TaxID=265470 RepID=UPI00037CAE3A|nr:hypothetical protein [Desulfurispora thermophila]
MPQPRLNLEQFEQMFLQVLQSGLPGQPVSLQSIWQELADEQQRRALLQKFKEVAGEATGVELVISPGMENFQGQVQSVVIQLFHVYSTVHLMERINAKILARRA